MEPKQTRNKLPKTMAAGADERAAAAMEAWRLFAIMSEFVDATDRLHHVHPAVSNAYQDITLAFRHYEGRGFVASHVERERFHNL